MVSRLLLLSEKDVSRILQEYLAPSSILESIGRALHTFSSHNDNVQAETPTIQNPLRTNILMPKHSVLFMPSRLGSEDTTSIKVVSVPRKDGDKAGLPATTLVLDEATGETRAALNARALTAVRTAAASALALSMASRASTAETLLVFGSGAQALWHARLVSSLSNNLREVIIACRARNERSQSLVSELQAFLQTQDQGRFGKVSVSGCLIEDAVKPGGPIEIADLVCCCTPTLDPLFSASRLKAGAGLSLIGSYKPHMREVDLLPLFTANPSTKRIILDSKSACLKEAGELYQLRDHLQDSFDDIDLIELGSLLDEQGKAVSNASPVLEDDVTIFKCVGVGVMDSAISALILREAEKHDIGTHIEF